MKMHGPSYKKILNEIPNTINNSLIVGGIFCNLGKANDCVKHDTGQHRFCPMRKYVCF
jgi:hypothetical protein